MIAKYNKRSLQVGIPGIVLQYGGAVFYWDFPLLSLISVLLGTALIATGIGFYIRSKARSLAFLLVGIIPVLGLVVVALLQDRSSPHAIRSA